MQIQLKQSEITDALKQYISLKGIDLADKVVDISFTAGRKEGGLSAEITIDDQDIPGYSHGGEQGVLTLVPSDAPVTEAAAGDEPNPAAESEVTAEAPKVATSSLFN